MALNDPPCEFAPDERLKAVDDAVQFVHGARLTLTSRCLTVVAAHVDVLLLELLSDRL